MKQKLIALIVHQRISLAQAEHFVGNGLISHATFEAYCRVWRWLAPRFGGDAGLQHERFWNQHGKVAYYARINRYRAAFSLEPLRGTPDVH